METPSIWLGVSNQILGRFRNGILNPLETRKDGFSASATSFGKARMEIGQIKLYFPTGLGSFHSIISILLKGSGDFFHKCKATSVPYPLRGFKPPYYAFVSGVPTLVSKQGNTVEYVNQFNWLNISLVRSIAKPNFPFFFSRPEKPTLVSQASLFINFKNTTGITKKGGGVLFSTKYSIGCNGVGCYCATPAVRCAEILISSPE